MRRHGAASETGAAFRDNWKADPSSPFLPQSPTFVCWRVVFAETQGGAALRRALPGAEGRFRTSGGERRRGSYTRVAPDSPSRGKRPPCGLQGCSSSAHDGSAAIPPSWLQLARAEPLPGPQLAFPQRLLPTARAKRPIPNATARGSGGKSPSLSTSSQRLGWPPGCVQRTV